jgi:hypothetical protein
MLQFRRTSKEIVEEHLKELFSDSEDAPEQVAFILNALNKQEQQGKNQVRDWLTSIKVYDVEQCVLAFFCKAEITSR